MGSHSFFHYTGKLKQEEKMRKNILLIIGVILVVAGCILGTFANFPASDIVGFAVTMLGAGVAAWQMWSKRDKSKQTWLSVLSIVLVAAGAFLLGFGGFSQDTMTMIITAVCGLVAVIAGLIASGVQRKTQEQLE